MSEIKKNQITIIDNFLAQDGFYKLSNLVTSTDFPWYKSITTDDSKESFNVYDFSWFHMVYQNESVLSPVYSLIHPLLVSAFDYIGEPVNSFLRFRLALQTTIGQPYVNDAHVDDMKPHKNAILYLANSDGETIVYNEKYNPDSKMHYRHYLENVLKNELTVGIAVQPIENTLLVFNGLHYHSSQRPVSNADRVILNINYN